MSFWKCMKKTPFYHDRAAIPANGSQSRCVLGDIRHRARKTLFCHEILEDFKKQEQGQSTLKN